MKLRPALKIAGADLSLRGPALAVARLDWGGDFTRVEWCEWDGGSLPLGSPDGERIERARSVAEWLVRTCRELGVGYVGIEGYAYSQAEHAHALGELGGLARDRLDRERIGYRSVNSASARSLLLGRLPRVDERGRRNDPKRAVERALLAAGAPQGLSGDLYDAAAILNWTTGELGGVCLAQLAPPRGHDRSRKVTR